MQEAVHSQYARMSTVICRGLHDGGKYRAHPNSSSDRHLGRTLLQLHCILNLNKECTASCTAQAVPAMGLSKAAVVGCRARQHKHRDDLLSH